MKVELAWGERNANAKFRVKGGDVAAAVKFLNARGEWGRFDGQVAYTWKANGQGFVTLLKVTPSFMITMPTWRAYLSQRREIKDEWDAMYRALKEHEEGHRQIFEAGVRKLIQDLEAKAVIKGGEVKGIIDAARDAIQKEHDAYDTRTDHGRSTGVKLTIR